MKFIVELSHYEKQALQVAQRSVLEGWATRKLLPGECETGRLPSELAGLPQGLIGDLESFNPARHRDALRDRALKAYILTEGRRNAALRSIYYFRTKFGADEKLTFSKVAAVIDADWQQWCRPQSFSNTEPGKVLRRELLPGIGDDTTRLWLARFCWLFLIALGRQMATYDPIDLNDNRLRDTLLMTLIEYCSALTDDDLARTVDDIGRIVDCREPASIWPYTDILYRPGWKERALAAQWKVKEHAARQAAVAAEQATLAAEKERAAAAEAAKLVAYQRRLAEEYCKFEIEEECIDIQPRDYPKLERGGGARLLTNMQVAFKQARRVRIRMIWKDREFSAVRSFASMSAKHLACLKIALWGNRAGISSPTADYLFWLLNCDGRVQVRGSDWACDNYMEYQEGREVDLEKEWSHYLDLLDKWIDDEGPRGELIRWFVEDRDSDNGWATSR
ncbi:MULTISPECIES: hypothetical protein [Bradyrhizobium]|nr:MULTISPECIES: hypothetical protein [Bradyrhizobium]RTE88410.1 hypothetical protein D6B98_35945 [Bradyrhizobium sp. LVM 105]TFV70233.1 hypothetical protein E4K64_30730 [Bradyrhizobium frederickii]